MDTVEVLANSSDLLNLLVYFLSESLVKSLASNEFLGEVVFLKSLASMELLGEVVLELEVLLKREEPPPTFSSPSVEFSFLFLVVAAADVLRDSALWVSSYFDLSLEDVYLVESFPEGESSTVVFPLLSLSTRELTLFASSFLSLASLLLTSSAAEAEILVFSFSLEAFEEAVTAVGSLTRDERLSTEPSSLSVLELESVPVGLAVAFSRGLAGAEEEDWEGVGSPAMWRSVARVEMLFNFSLTLCMSSGCE